MTEHSTGPQGRSLFDDCMMLLPYIKESFLNSMSPSEVYGRSVHGWSSNEDHRGTSGPSGLYDCPQFIIKQFSESYTKESDFWAHRSLSSFVFGRSDVYVSFFRHPCYFLLLSSHLFHLPSHNNCSMFVTCCGDNSQL